MKPFLDSTSFIDDPDQLRQQFNDNGYIFLRNLVDVDKLTALRKQFIQIMQSCGWLKNNDHQHIIPSTIPYVEGEEEYFKVYDEIQKLESFHSLSHDPEVMRIMQILLGETAFPHPLSIARLVFPGNNAWATPPHQDYPNNQGTEDLLACWMPLTDCPTYRSGLSILEGSHKLGLMPLKFSLGAGHRQVDLSAQAQQLEWCASDIQLGDALIFHSLTIHRSLENTTPEMRLSVDYRYQREHEPLTENSLNPHFQRVPWSEIYKHWNSKALQYYWQDKDFSVVDWRDLHKISEAEEQDGLKQRIIYDRKRKSGAPP